MREEDWSFKTISRYLYGVLYNHTDPDFQSIVEQCEDEKDGIEAYRLLASHCDPLNFNTNNTLMEAITKHGRRKVNPDPRTAIDDFLIAVRDVKKSLSEYEKRVAKLPEAKTTWIPSMMVELMDASMLTFVRQQGASGDLDKMEAAIKELRTINKSVGARANLKKIQEREPEPFDEETQEQEDEEAFQEWASDPSISKDRLLAAIGKGSGKGNGRPRFVPRAKSKI